MADTEGLIRKERHRQPPSLYYPPLAPNEGASGGRNEPAWKGTLQILQKNWVLSVAFALTVLIGVIMLTALMTPTYEPSPMSPRSRYHDCTGVVRAPIRSTARAENVTGESPGGTPRHFCVPE